MWAGGRLDGPTDMTKLAIALFNCANTPKNYVKKNFNKDTRTDINRIQFRVTGILNNSLLLQHEIYTLLTACYGKEF
jgi:hypothetical protein